MCLIFMNSFKQSKKFLCAKFFKQDLIKQTEV